MAPAFELKGNLGNVYSWARKPTGLMRFVSRSKNDEHKMILQQQWAGIYGEEPEWLDVPYVEPDAE